MGKAKPTAILTAAAYVTVFCLLGVAKADSPLPQPSSQPAGPAVAAAPEPVAAQPQNWNIHLQNTDIVQGDPAFRAKYTGPNSLNRNGEVQQTVTLDLFAGVRLWPGAEAHVDALAWQGYGLTKTFGIEAFPNGDAYKVGTHTPDYMAARLFVRQTIGFGGEQEDVPDGQMTLAGKQDVSRLTITAGRMAVTDIFDKNSYANDPHTQFMNWSAIANLAFDYAADSVGFTTGIAFELNQSNWTLRYGFFQMPALPNSFTGDDQFLKAPPAGDDGPFLKSWEMPVEFEYRYTACSHSGVVRLLAWVNQAHMAQFNQETAIIVAQGVGADTTVARTFRCTYGFGFNGEQEVAPGVGVFSRIGWNAGHTEAWAYSDTNYSASLGLSVKGKAWDRPDDTFGLFGVISGISKANQNYLKAGGLGILDGDGTLHYAWEKVIETYYDFDVWRSVHFALDYQLIIDPAFNRDRGPVSVFGARLHWEL